MAPSDQTATLTHGHECGRGANAFICIYIYDYICIYVRAYVRTYVRMYIRMYDLLFTSPFIPGLSNQTRKLSVAASIYVANQTIFSWLTIYPH